MSNEFQMNLSKVNDLFSNLVLAERYGAYAAAAANSWAFSIANTLISIEERNIQLAALQERNITLHDSRMDRLASWIKDLEMRLERQKDLHAWFRTIAVNEGMSEFLPNADDVIRRMGETQSPELDEVEHHAKVTGSTVAEARNKLMANAKARAEEVAKTASSVKSTLNTALDISGDTICELNNFEARRIVEHIETKADQYAERIEERLTRMRGRTRRQRMNKEQAAGSLKLLESVVDTAGKFADELNKRIEAGTMRQDEEHYDTNHGTTYSIA